MRSLNSSTRISLRITSFILSMLFCVNAFAIKLKIGDPKFILVVESTAIGETGWIRNDDTGMYHFCRLEKKWHDQEGNLWIEVKKVDNKFTVRMDDDAITISPSRDQNFTIDIGELDFSPGSFIVGLDTAALAAIQYAFIKNSGALEDIQKSMLIMQKLRMQMGEHIKLIESAQFNLASNILQLKMMTENFAELPNIISTGLSNSNVKVWVVSNVPENKAALATYKWSSDDTDFIERANAIRDQLINSKVDDAMAQKYYDISTESLIQADQNSFFGNKEQAFFLLDIAKVAADVLVGLDPFTGMARSIYETVMGTNLITGAELSNSERVLAALGILSGGYALKAYNIIKVLRPMANKLGSVTISSYRFIEKFLEKTGHGFQLVSSSDIRKVNFRGLRDPKWGLNARHLNKHFFGDSKYALRTIDPGGNSDNWMTNLMDVIQRPVTKITANGKLDIMHYYPRSDGNGFYKLGVRLSKNYNKTFDLVTVLTRQD
ncbi:MAG: hypothetical protein A2Z20_02530 [Bdellovibrionales bacterium RBG_16_40_8]|nr:MAG: hypothetical protein A2Z20_02530 [Bdellovibrionales bacterium RBG_16_40_8]